MTNTTSVRPPKSASESGKAGKPAPAKRRAAPAAPRTAKTKVAEKTIKRQKVKLVRDGFTIPEDEYAQLAELKKRLLLQGIAAKKTEILRAALKVFAGLSDAKVIQAVGQLQMIKAGRPGKEG